MRFSIDELVRLTSAKVIRWVGPSAVQPIHEVLTAKRGDLFFAMRPSLVGQETLNALCAKGASGVAVFSGQVPPGQEFSELGVLSLASPALAFFTLAAEARRRAQPLVVGVTGTSGKSATKEYVAAALSGHYKTLKTPDSLNRISDVALVLLSLSQGTSQAAVVEMGFGQTGDIDRMAEMAKPDYGVITNVTMAHLDGAGGSWESVAMEKGRLADHLNPRGALILNADDPGCHLINHHWQDRRIFTFGFGPLAMVRVQEIKLGEQGCTFELRAFGKRLHCSIQAVGAVQTLNAAAAILVAHLAGVSMAQARDQIAAVPPLARRFEVYRFDRSLSLIDDTFSASPDAMTHGLASAGDLAGHRRKVAVLSDIALLGEHSSEKHRAIGRVAAAAGFSDLILLGDSGLADIRLGAIEGGVDPQSICLVRERADLLPTILRYIHPETLIYCKARQGLWIGPIIDEVRRAAMAQGFELLIGRST